MRRTAACGLLALPPDERGRRLPLRHDARARLRPVRRTGARDGHASSRRTTTSACARSCSRSRTRSAPRCRCSRSRYGGREAAARLRRHAQTVRLVSGALIAAVALGSRLPPRRPPRDAHARATRRSCRTRSRTTRRRSASSRRCAAAAQALAAVHDRRLDGLPDYGVAPPLHADGAWINSQPLTLAQLRGKVVLVDFWTYSCINCLRTLPHLKSWYAAYHDKGLVIIGVHTPEFAFEHVTSNVRAAVKRLGITYPVMQDNRYKTWDNYANQYWPAEYLIDKHGPRSPHALRRGRVRPDRVADPPAARRQRHARAADRRHDADRAADARELPRLRAPRELRRLAIPSRTVARATRFAGHRSRRTRSPTAATGASARSDRRRAERAPAAAVRREERLHRRSAAAARCTRCRRQADRRRSRRRAAALHGARVEQADGRAARAALLARHAGVLVHVRLDARPAKQGAVSSSTTPSRTAGSSPTSRSRLDGSGNVNPPAPFQCFAVSKTGDPVDRRLELLLDRHRRRPQ